MCHSLKVFLGMVIALPLAFASPAPSLVPRQATTTAPCATGAHLMIAGGCQSPCTTGDTYGQLASLISNITSAIPGSDTYIVPYTNSSNPGMAASPLMINATKQYAQTCPNTPIVFVGYSVGGIVVMNTLCGGIGTNLTKNVIFANVYGEETYVAGLSYDKGNCTNNAPQYPRANTAACMPYAPVLQSYCLSTDPECCTNGSMAFSHYDYPQIYDGLVLNNITAAYSSYRLSQINNNSTSSSTSSTSSTVAPVVAVPATSSTSSSTSSSSSSASVSLVTRTRTTTITSGGTTKTRTITRTRTVVQKTTAAA